MCIASTMVLYVSNVQKFAINAFGLTCPWEGKYSVLAGSYCFAN